MSIGEQLLEQGADYFDALIAEVVQIAADQFLGTVYSGDVGVPEQKDITLGGSLRRGIERSVAIQLETANSVNIVSTAVSDAIGFDYPEYQNSPSGVHTGWWEDKIAGNQSLWDQSVEIALRQVGFI